MAFGKVNVSVDTQEIKRYIGVGKFFVRGVNPTKKESDEFFGRESENEPQYYTEAELDGEKIPQARITFLLELHNAKNEYLNADGTPAELKTSITFFLRKRYRYTRDKAKIQVIDKYGYSGWATKEELEKHSQLLSKDGKPLRITTQYRPAYDGEIELVEFLKYYLNITEAVAWINNEWRLNPKVSNPDDCEISLAKISEYFTGNISELQEATKMGAANFVQILFGVKTTEEGRQYQAAFTRKVARGGSNSFNEINRSLTEAKNNGAFGNVEFEVTALHEYKVIPTNLDTPTASPFDTQDSQSDSDLPW